MVLTCRVVGIKHQKTWTCVGVTDMWKGELLMCERGTNMRQLLTCREGIIMFELLICGGINIWELLTCGKHAGGYSHMGEAHVWRDVHVFEKCAGAIHGCEKCV